jgi:hypothetical protein
LRRPHVAASAARPSVARVVSPANRLRAFLSESPLQEMVTGDCKPIYARSGRQDVALFLARGESGNPRAA